MVNKKKWVASITIALLGIGFLYLVFRFYRAHRIIQREKSAIGYKSPVQNLPNPVFISEEWKLILIDSDIKYTDGAHNIVPYDLDNDGKVELIANSYRSDALLIYMCNGNCKYYLNWKRYVLDPSVGGGISRRPFIKQVKSMLKEKLLGGYTGGAHYTAIADMNGDGRKDLVIAGDFKRYDVVLYEAPEDITNIHDWKKHAVYKNDSHRTYHVETGDINGDGDHDIVFATKTDNSIGWLKNERLSSDWPLTWVDKNCIRCFNVRVADIDNDGQNDIIASEDDSIKGGKIHLYSYSNNPTLQANWINRVIENFAAGHGVSVFEIIDIDSDGDLDIVTSNHQGDVFILENAYPEDIYREWNKYRVNNYDISKGHNFREVDIGDIDSDGDLDIIVADEGKNGVLWFENSGTTFYENWEMHIIDKSNQYLKWCHFVELGDIDGDGDLDITVAAAASNVFLLYLNYVDKNNNKQ